MHDANDFCLLTVEDFTHTTLPHLTCVVFDQDLFPTLRGALENMISEDRVWHIIVIGDKSSEIEDKIDDIISIKASGLLMTSGVENYDFQEIFSLATMMPDDGDWQRRIAYVYDDFDPKLHEIAERMAKEAGSITGLRSRSPTRRPGE